ncbi:hypothetical protein H4O14_02295 [Bacillus sp. PAMC26568]|nr:hypothetical protein H4O14_02295 [Bacillus sp. PAMC26568]
MKITHTLVADEIIQRLEEQDQKNKLQGEIIESLRKKKVSVMESVIEQMSPIYDWVSKKSYSFVHPDSDHETHIGPLLYDDGNYLYILTEKRKSVIRIDLFTNDETRLPFKEFVEFCPFDIVMSGLFYPKEMLGVYIKENEAEIRSNEKDISKYEIWVK